MKCNQLYFTFSLVVISIYLYSCNSSSKSDAQNESASETEEVMEATEEPMGEAPEEMEAEVSSPFDDPTKNKSIDVNLKGVYVTSTKMPHNQYSYANLFDGKPTTFWESMKGAGPYEGIML